jgi:hypothetical protein
MLYSMPRPSVNAFLHARPCLVMSLGARYIYAHTRKGTTHNSPDPGPLSDVQEQGLAQPQPSTQVDAAQERGWLVDSAAGIRRCCCCEAAAFRATHAGVSVRVS